MVVGAAGTGVLCAFPGDVCGEQPSLRVGQESGGVRGTLNLGAGGGGVPGFPTVLTLTLFLIFVFAWLGVVLWSWSFPDLGRTKWG